MNHPSVIIIVPVYKESLSTYEEVSFRQCLKILGKYPIGIICPDSLQLDNYQKIANEYNKSIHIINFEQIYFYNIQGYNMLLLSKHFYKTFLEYTFILIYQLDAYVFKDELPYWCNQNWDYIGAPWFENFGSYEAGDKLTMVGNGGFSLRKTKALYDMLNYKFPLKNLKYLYYTKLRNKSIRHVLEFFLKLFGFRNNANYIINRYISMNANEDLFFSTEYTGSKIKLKIPPVSVAIQFSFDISPEYLFSLNHQTLPFGCHGWYREDGIYTTTNTKNFWKSHIDMKNSI